MRSHSHTRAKWISSRQKRNSHISQWGMKLAVPHKCSWKDDQRNSHMFQWHTQTERTCLHNHPAMNHTDLKPKLHRLGPCLPHCLNNSDCLICIKRNLSTFTSCKSHCQSVDVLETLEYIDRKVSCVLCKVQIGKMRIPTTLNQIKSDLKYWCLERFYLRCVYIYRPAGVARARQTREQQKRWDVTLLTLWDHSLGSSWFCLFVFLCLFCLFVFRLQIPLDTEAFELAPCISHLYILPHHGAAFQIYLNIYLPMVIINKL